MLFWTAAKIGEGILLDHGTGVVIGETVVVGNRVSLMHVSHFHSLLCSHYLMGRKFGYLCCKQPSSLCKHITRCSLFFACFLLCCLFTF